MCDFRTKLAENKKLVYRSEDDVYEFSPLYIKGREGETSPNGNLFIKEKNIRNKDYLKSDLFMNDQDIKTFLNCSMTHERIETLLKRKLDKAILISAIKSNCI